MRLSLTLLVALAFAPPASAAPLRFVDRGTAGYDLRTDGHRLIAWDTGQGSADVYDVVTRRRGNIGAPANCSFADLSRDQDLLWSCNDRSGVIQEFASANRTPLPTLTAPGPESPAYVGLGSRWIRVRRGGYHYAYDVYVNRATGQTSSPTDNNRRQIFDLDAPSLTRPLCRGMRRPLVRDIDDRTVPGPLAIAGRRAAATTFTDDEYPRSTVLLQRCGHRQQVLQHCGDGFCSQPVITSRIVAWIRTRRPHARLFVRALKTGKVRSRRLPRPAGRVSPLLVGSRLFLGVDGRLVEVVL